MMYIKPVGDIALVNNQWKYKYMFCDDITLDIPIPWDVEIPPHTSNFMVDFGVSIDSKETYMVIPRSNIGKLRMSFTPSIMSPGINRLIIHVDNGTSGVVSLYAAQHYITLVSLTNEGIIFKYDYQQF